MILKISLTMKRETWVNFRQKACSKLSIKTLKTCCKVSVSNFWGGKFSNLTHFFPKLRFIPLEYVRKFCGFLMFSGGIEI